MEKKIVKVPFDVEMAKKITNGEIDGRIVTRDGRSARVICWDKQGSLNPIVALIEKESEYELLETYKGNGMYYVRKDDNLDLMLEIPEYMTFKDGDVLKVDGFDTILIQKGDVVSDGDIAKCNFYIAYQNGEILTYVNFLFVCLNKARKATKKEIEDLINKAKKDDRPEVKECLKRFFNIEVKSKCDFKVGQPVIGIDGRGEWRYDLFSHYKPEYRNGNYVCSARSYSTCLPYNEQTAHLLGTTEDYKGD